ncbi:DUF4365 domain-containing protein [Pedobacter panaciterrae]|uniref:DUF4365 domain-containing protein n=1 Tax=Pedobacter panaciterrae TaxID=363849 RepID=UPI0025999A9E|nr:DUF4365 domain-containing protein [uncultured Pedobacter sp.]
MSFYDDPIVDDNSKRSEESVNVVKSLFTRKNGFISKEETPDYGVDLDVELVLNQKNASSYKFAIQIKSTIAVKIIDYDSAPYISFPFKTSRLKYLAKRAPSYGLVIIYDDTNSKAYFDYVEEIIKRLDEHPQKIDWRNHDQVSLLIPSTPLTSDILPEIHQKFRTRFENNNALLKEHGRQFNIPYLETNTNSADKLDLKDPIKLAKFLEIHGNMLFNENEFKSISQMLGIVNKQQINSSPELIFLSAITYTRMGDVVEAEYYIRKAKKIKSQLSEEYNRIINFSELRIEFLKGNIDHALFSQKFRELSAWEVDIENKLTLDINAIWMDFMTSLDDLDKLDLLHEIEQIWERISQAELSIDKKHVLNVYLSEVQHSYGVEKFLRLYHKYKIKESLQVPMSDQERATEAIAIAGLTESATSIVGKAYNYGNENKLPILKAISAHQLGKNFFTMRSALRLVAQEDKMQVNQEKLIESYLRNQTYCLVAYTLFLELHMFENAHNALTTTYEIQKLGFEITGVVSGPRSPDQLLKIIREIETAYDLMPFESAVDNMSSLSLKRNKNDREILKDASEKDLERFAKDILAAYQLPEERLPYILHDLNILKTFEQRCNNPNIELLQDLTHMQSNATKYAQPPIYILRHKTLNIQTKPSSDIESLLNEFSSVLNPKTE